ncbi:hypothetical protein ASPACDRAFT_47707, partial [Aspergillus aculeatus ATCC 16872]
GEARPPTGGSPPPWGAGRACARGPGGPSNRPALPGLLQQGYLTAYTTRLVTSVVCRGFIPARGDIAIRQPATGGFSPGAVASLLRCMARRPIPDRYYSRGEPQHGRLRMRMLLERSANLLPPQSLPRPTRYHTVSRFDLNLIGRHPNLDEMVFQELEWRREPWPVVERLFRWAKTCARERRNPEFFRTIEQYSWRVRYPV